MLELLSLEEAIIVRLLLCLNQQKKKKRFSLGGGEVESVGKKWEGRLVLCFRD